MNDHSINPKRVAAGKRAASTRAAAKKAELAARRKEARETPLVLADINKLRSAIAQLSGDIQRIDQRVGRMHLTVATLVGHCVINPKDAGALVGELAARMSLGELEKIGLKLDPQPPSRPAKVSPDASR